MEKLPEDFKQKWIAALRSGEFKQGLGSLKTVYEDGSVKHCCLGVACRVAGFNDECLSDYKYPTPLAQMPEAQGRIPTLFRTSAPGSIPWVLSYMNDSGKSFSEIADCIEQNL